MITEEELTFRPLTDTSTGGPVSGPPDQAYVRLHIDQRDNHILEIFIPMVLVGTEFKVGQLCEHSVSKSANSSLRWYLFKAFTHGRFPPLKRRGGYFTFTKTTDERRMEKALSRFPVRNFGVYVKAHMDEGQRGKVIVLEMQAPLEQVFGLRHPAPPEDGPAGETVVPVVPLPVAPAETQSKEDDVEAMDAGAEPTTDINTEPAMDTDTDLATDAKQSEDINNEQA